MMGLLRGIRTVFFLITMIVSFLFFSAPILVAITDALLPTALFSASIPPSDNNNNQSFLFFLFKTISFQLSSYDFRYSLIDIPIVSVIRSGIILCVYGLCDGRGLSTGPYLGITTVCSVLSLLFVSLKASYVFGRGGVVVGVTELALFVCSPALAIGHIVVAYRTSCRERRKLLVYKIDIEAVPSISNFIIMKWAPLMPDHAATAKNSVGEGIKECPNCMLIFNTLILMLQVSTFKIGFRRYSKMLHDARVKVKLQN